MKIKVKEFLHLEKEEGGNPEIEGDDGNAWRVGYNQAIDDIGDMEVELNIELLHKESNRFLQFDDFDITGFIKWMDKALPQILKEG